MDRRAWRLLRFAALLVVIVVGLLASQRGQDGEQRAPSAPAVDPAEKTAVPVEEAVAKTPAQKKSPAPKAEPKYIVRDVTIKDLEGDVAFAGDVDLSQTLARIDAGERLRFRNDGVTFENREKRLPRKATGYYREWVHPTPGLSGPGPQRVVTGKEGEAYYTPDHYRTFEQLR